MPGNEIEISKEMIEAGVAVLEDVIESYDHQLIVECIYKAMREAAPTGSDLIESIQVAIKRLAFWVSFPEYVLAQCETLLRPDRSGPSKPAPG